MLIHDLGLFINFGGPALRSDNNLRRFGMRLFDDRCRRPPCFSLVIWPLKKLSKSLILFQ
jgi:hypothetical protein